LERDYSIFSPQIVIRALFLAEKVLNIAIGACSGNALDGTRRAASGRRAAISSQ
jgi:hypothetical protein